MRNGFAPYDMLTGVVTIAAHKNLSAAVKSDGTVWWWGEGISTTGATQAPFSGAISVGLGSNAVDPSDTTIFVLKNDGTVQWYGANTSSSGQVSGLSGIVGLATDDGTQVALKNDGTVWSWGYDSSHLSSATQISGLSNVSAIWANNGQRLARKSDGTFCYINNGATVTGFSGVTVTSAAIGVGQYLAAKSDGTISAWGSNTYGQLGNGNYTDSSTPVAVSEISVSDTTPPSGPANLLATYVGPVSLRLTWNAAPDNVAVTQYQVFRGTTTVGTTTTTSMMVTGLSASTSYNFTVRACDASGNWSQPSLPLSVMTSPSLAAGANHSLAVRMDGSVWSWGLFTSGQLGAIVGNGQYSPVPGMVTGLNSGFAQVAAGISHSLALKTDGTVYAWGDNTYGEVGDGTWTQRWTPVQVKTNSSTYLTGVIAIGAHRNSSAAVKSDGSVWLWGAPNFTLPVSTPFSDAMSVGLGRLSGYDEIYVLKKDGTVWWRGYNPWGSSEYDWETDTWYWVGCDVECSTISGLSGIVALATDDDYQMALKNDGTVWVWGNNENHSDNAYQIGGLTAIVGIAAQNGHRFAWRSDGTVYAWGNNSNGQIGNGNTSTLYSPTLVTNWASGGVIPKSFAVGDNFTLAVMSNATVKASGQNTYGQLGNNSTTQSTTPVVINGLSAGDGSAPSIPINLQASFIGPVSVRLTWDASTDNVGASQYRVFRGATAMGISPTNFMLVTGLSASTTYSLTVQAGDAEGNWSPVSFPLMVTTGPTLAAGANHSVAVKPDGSVWAWGRNDSYQTGDLSTPLNRTTPVAVSGLTGGIAQLAAGDNHTLALKNDGTVWSWGDPGHQQLGSGASAGIVAPVKLWPLSSTPILSGVVAIAARHNVSAAVKSDGSVWWWGESISDGAKSAGFTGAVAVTLGLLPGTIFVLKNDGTVWWSGSWSTSEYDEESDTWYTYSGYTDNAPVSGLSSVVAISAGDGGQFALKSDGTVWVISAGFGPTATASQDGRFSNIISIVSGQWNRFLSKSDGSVYVWGENGSGQLGDGTYISRAPTLTANWAGAKGFGLGNNHSLAIMSDGTIQASGLNTYGQLGNNSTTQSNVPVFVSGFGGGNADATPPTAPTNLQASNVTSTSLTLSWTAATDNVGVTGYQIFKGNTSIATPTGLSQSVTGLDLSSSSITFTVRARDAAGNWSGNTGITVGYNDTIAPTAPPQPAYAELTDRSVTIFWGPATDNVGVTQYEVFRKNNTSQVTISLGTTTQRVFLDTGLTPSNGYTYTVVAYDAKPNTSPASPPLSVTTSASLNADDDTDGIPNAVESVLGTATNSAATVVSPTSSAVNQNVHRPTP